MEFAPDESLTLRRKEDPRFFGAVFLAGAVFLVFWLLYLQHPASMTEVQRIGIATVGGSFLLLIGTKFLRTSPEYTFTSEALLHNNKQMRWKDLTRIQVLRSTRGDSQNHYYITHYLLICVKDGGTSTKLCIPATLKEQSREGLGALLQAYCLKNGNPLPLNEYEYPGR